MSDSASFTALPAQPTSSADLARSAASNSRLFEIGRVLRGDLRSLAWPLLLYLGLLASTFILWLPAMSTLGEEPHSFSEADFLIFVAGFILGGLFVLQHPLTPQAFWRTRPWRPGSILISKLLEIMVFAWLPMASFQLALIAATGLEAPSSGLMLFEMLLAGPVLPLFGAALAAICGSVRSFLVAGLASVVVCILVLPMTLQFLFPGRPYTHFSTTHFLLMAVLCVVILAASYCAPAFQRRTFAAALLAFAMLWVPAFSIDLQSLPWLFESPRGRVSPPAQNLSLSPPLDDVALCINLDFENLQEDERANYVIHYGEIRGVPGLLDPKYDSVWNFSTAIPSQRGTEEKDSRASGAQIRRSERLKPLTASKHRDAKVDVTFLLDVRIKKRRELIEKPLESASRGQLLAGPDGVKVWFHFAEGLEGPDLTVETRLPPRVWNLSSSESHHVRAELLGGLSNGSSFSGYDHKGLPRLLFRSAQFIDFEGQRQTFRTHLPAQPRSLHTVPERNPREEYPTQEEVLQNARWVMERWTTVYRGRETHHLQDVRLGDLLCD